MTVVTQVRNREVLQQDPLAKLAPIHFIDNDQIAGPALRLGRLPRGGQTNGWTINTALAWPSYLSFERRVERLFRNDFREGRFDLIHRVTPISPVMPSPLATWTDVPMILGPLNGGLPWPKDYPTLRRREKEWLLSFRNLHRILPYFSSTYRKAAAVISASQHTSSEIPRGEGKRYFLFENGVDPSRFLLANSWQPPLGPFRSVTVGRLAAGKAIDLTLRAMASSKILRGCKLTVVGDWQERANLEAIIREQGLEDVVELVGWLDQTSVSAQLRLSQAFVFPSLKEFGGGVVMESMSAGLPSIVCDYGGPGEIISPETGFRLPLVPPDELIPSIRAAMERLATDHSLCAAMGEAALKQVREEFLWSAKAEKIVDIYHAVTQSRRHLITS